MKPIAHQGRLPISVANNTTLLTVDTARAVLGVDAETIYALCESGALSHAFDLVARGAGEMPSIRIWQECVARRQRMEPQPAVTDAEALDAIVGFARSEFIAAGHVAQRFTTHRSTILRLHQTGQLVGSFTGHKLQFRRADVIRFLAGRRYLGARRAA